MGPLRQWLQLRFDFDSTAGRNVGRRTVVALSNCSRTAAELLSNRSLSTALHHVAMIHVERNLHAVGHMLRAKCSQSVLPDVVRVSLGGLEDHQRQKVAAASRLRDNEGFGARGRDARVRASRPDRPPSSRSARLDVRHQGARRAFLPDSQPQPAAFRTRSFPRYVCCLQG